MIGGNSLSAHKERKALLPQEVVEEMKFIFEIFSLYCGVFVSSVLPRTTTTAIREQITQLNSHLQQEFGMRYIGKSRVSPEFLCSDKIHLSRSGAERFVNKFRKIFHQRLSLTTS